MVKSLLSRLTGKNRKSQDEVPTPDLSRVLGKPSSAPSQAPPVESDATLEVETIEVDEWLRADLDQLESSWTQLAAAPKEKSARDAFTRALHNLHGASGAYGGGALTRLTTSLQKLVSHSEDLVADAALINLHIQACRATRLADHETGDQVAEAVCSALETQVETRLATA